jgi:hypothetical protein
MPFPSEEATPPVTNTYLTSANANNLTVNLSEKMSD